MRQSAAFFASDGESARRCSVSAVAPTSLLVGSSNSDFHEFGRVTLDMCGQSGQGGRARGWTIESIGLATESISCFPTTRPTCVMAAIETPELARKAVVVGGGPVGCLVALSLAKSGWRVEVYEGRSGGSLARA